ncbi:MAG: LPS export ABC transporter ATP-binding protein [Candidatus Dadabacteria bacterium]|nr:MAG: LPS export ABC transporter ATP-binding protein [Candidatus Dadabacteria bacterium]
MNLTASGLRKRFGRRWVVEGVDIEVRPGETVGLLGPNGAGKTTTFYMLVGIERPDAGTVRIGDHEVTHEPLYKRARRGIRYLPQEPSVFQRMTVIDNIIAVLEIAGVPREQRRLIARERLEEFGLSHLERQRGYMLSGGERRRLEIARAMATEPAFFLLDEPFAGIDPLAVEDLQRLVRGICQRGIGVLISDHNVRETLTLCDRAYVMDAGAVLVEGAPEQITSHAEARARYLGEKFRLN